MLLHSSLDNRVSLCQKRGESGGEGRGGGRGVLFCSVRMGTMDLIQILFQKFLNIFSLTGDIKC